MNATPNFPQIPALPTSFYWVEWKESGWKDVLLIMKHMIKASKFVPDVTISLKLFETKLSSFFCACVILSQISFTASSFSALHCRVQKRTVRNQLLSVICHIMMVPSFSIHGNELLFITTGLLTHINLLRNNVRICVTAICQECLISIHTFLICFLTLPSDNNLIR